MFSLTSLLGVFGIVWYVAWVIVVYESPAMHPTISSEEKHLIQATALDISKVRRVALSFNCLVLVYSLKKAKPAHQTFNIHNLKTSDSFKIAFTN